jgi:hypothetical protein
MLKPALILGAALAFASAPAFGAFIFTLDSSVQIGVADPATQQDPCLPGFTPSCVVFSGSLFDDATDNSSLFTNDISFVFDGLAGNYLSPDPTGQSASTPNSFFFNTTPGFFTGDGNPTDDLYTGPIFEIFISPDTPLGNYTGTINILGGASPFTDLNVLASETFTVVVSPEPGAMALLCAGLLALAGWRRRSTRV